MQRFWVSWLQDTDDHRPLTYPPNNQILGWWCSGYDFDGNSLICACVIGNGLDIEEQKKDAIRAIEREWPEATSSKVNRHGWRFFEFKDNNWKPDNRFPLTDWMEQRF